MHKQCNTKHQLYMIAPSSDLICWARHIIWDISVHPKALHSAYWFLSQDVHLLNIRRSVGGGKRAWSLLYTQFKYVPMKNCPKIDVNRASAHKNGQRWSAAQFSSLIFPMEFPECFANKLITKSNLPCPQIQRWQWTRVKHDYIAAAWCFKQCLLNSPTISHWELSSSFVIEFPEDKKRLQMENVGFRWNRILLPHLPHSWNHVYDACMWWWLLTE